MLFGIREAQFLLDPALLILESVMSLKEVGMLILQVLVFHFEVNKLLYLDLLL